MTQPTEGSDVTMGRKISYLTTAEFARLNYACVPITEAFDRPPYLVGSSVGKDDYAMHSCVTHAHTSAQIVRCVKYVYNVRP